MEVDYLYCPKCGFESVDPIFAAFSATYANGDFYLCPECGAETSSVELTAVEVDCE